MNMWILTTWLAGCGTATSTTDTDDPVETPTDTSETDTGTTPTTPTPPTDNVTWHRDVRPLVDVHCNGCHSGGGVAPFTFDDPEQLDVLGPMMVSAVEARTMPPWSFRDGCREVEGDLALDEATRATFIAWGADGYLVGDEADYVAPELPEVVEPPTADLQAHPILGFTPDLTQPDDYLCMVTDVTVDQEMFVRWAEARPEHPEIVHHVIAYAVPPEQIPALERIAGGDLTHQFPCWESPVEYIGPTVEIWAPGPRPPYEELKDAVRVPAGSLIVLEVHYNNIGGAQPGIEDHTSVDLWTLPDEDVDHLLIVWPPTNYGIQIPAGEEESVNDIEVHLPVDADIATTAPHMHLLGTELRTEIHRTDGSTQCLSDVNWDFDWQRQYEVPDDAPIHYSGSTGETVDIRCVFDNSAANQPVVDGVRQEPRDVEWGDSSLDEMCMDFVVFRVPYDRTASKGLCGGFDHCYQACDPSDPECPLMCMGMSGGACYACGFTAMYDTCTTLHCARESVPMLACLARCEDIDSDVFGCQTEECGAELAAYQACAQPLFRDGTCARDYAGCSGMVP